PAPLARPPAPAGPVARRGWTGAAGRSGSAVCPDPCLGRGAWLAAEEEGGGGGAAAGGAGGAARRLLAQLQSGPSPGRGGQAPGSGGLQPGGPRPATR